MRTLFHAACLIASVVAAIGATSAQAQGGSGGGWQCVTYARSISAFDIRGNANTWWGQAAGRYQRGTAPAAGAVLAFKSAPGMRAGHVAIVREVLSNRELRIEHANWTIRGGVERDARAIDVSAAGDWSEVRVTYGSGLGQRVNPTFGFIYANAAPAMQMARAPRAPLQLGSDLVQLAAYEVGSAG